MQYRSEVEVNIITLSRDVKFRCFYDYKFDFCLPKFKVNSNFSGQWSKERCLPPPSSSIQLVSRWVTWSLKREIGKSF